MPCQNNQSCSCNNTASLSITSYWKNAIIEVPDYDGEFLCAYYRIEDLFKSKPPEVQYGLCNYNGECGWSTEVLYWTELPDIERTKITLVDTKEKI